MIKDELKKFPPGCIGGEFSIEKTLVNNRTISHVFYFEDNSLITLREFNSKLKLRELTLKEWYDYHYLPRDENGEYIYPKCKYCNNQAQWSQSKRCYLTYCENHYDKYFSELQSRRRHAQIKSIGPQRNDIGSFIKRLGYDEGTRRYNEMTSKMSHTRSLEGKIERYGKEEGLRRYEGMCSTAAKARTLKWHIERYGEEEGERIYKETLRKRQNSQSKDGLIRRFGKDEGLRRYNKRKIRDKKILEKYEKDYGLENAVPMYHLDKVRFSKRIDAQVSRISMKFFNDLSDRLWIMFNGVIGDDVLYGDSEMKIDISNKSKGRSNTYRKADFTIKSKNIIIEFNGDYWHPRPSNQNFLLSEITDRDEQRIRNDLNKLSEYRSLGYSVFYVHECDYKSNPDVTIEECIKFITNESFRNEYTEMLDSILNIKYTGPLNKERMD